MEKHIEEHEYISKFEVSEHGPGPPDWKAKTGEHSSSAAMNETSQITRKQSELRQKEDEIERLRAENKTFIGKIKGYQTLG